ncbi:unnamed protein product [Phaeothamnion confervicola]
MDATAWNDRCFVASSGGNHLRILSLPSFQLAFSQSPPNSCLLLRLLNKQEDKEALAALSAAGAAIDAALGGTVAALIKADEFKGAAKSTSATMVTVTGAPVRRVALVGLGKKNSGEKTKVDAGGGGDAFAEFGTQLAVLAKLSKAATMAVVLPEGADADAARSALEGMLLGLYSDTRYKTGDRAEKPPKLESVAVFAPAGVDIAAAASTAAAVASGVNFCRDVVNSPANFLTPASLAEAATTVAAEHGLEIEVLEEAEIVTRGMGAYMGVAQGAVNPPKFIHLTYKPDGAITKKVALVGKGLTFDSGGYNIKAGAGSMIEMMKFDMGGAGATLGAAKVIGQLRPAGIEAHFIVAACENMISDRAMRPGDILTASNGKTIEVINTDAEGRLTLADALVFAEGLGVDAIVDSATLTGAIIIALGETVAGVWASDDALASELAAAAAETGDRVWRMPLVADYGDQIKSKIADLKNVGGRGGSSITAALFLKEFVSDKTPWAHVDIAGPVWDNKAGGATGYGVRLLSQWVMNRATA